MKGKLRVSQQRQRRILQAGERASGNSRRKAGHTWGIAVRWGWEDVGLPGGEAEERWNKRIVLNII